MNEERPPSEAAEAKLPEKNFISGDQLDELWNMRGMKYRVDEMHKSMLERGLIPSVDRPAFRAAFRTIVKEFLVDGRAKRQPNKDPRPRFPKVF